MTYHISLHTTEGAHVAETMTSRMPMSAMAAARLVVDDNERIIVVAHSKGGPVYVETRTGTGRKLVTRKYHMTVEARP